MKDDLISRKAAIDALLKEFERDTPKAIRAKLTLENLPSAQSDMSEWSDKLWKAAYERGRAEAQDEIVRCKDCKHWLPHTQFGYDEDNDVYYNYCAKLIPEDEYYAFQREANDYCSFAERRNDERSD